MSKNERERVNSAFNAMKELGVPRQKVKPVLKQLYQVFEKNWELIEAEDYRVLKDAYFGQNENESVKDIENGLMEHSSSITPSGLMKHDDSTRPSKRLHLLEPEDPVSSTVDSSCKISGQEVIHIPKVTCQQEEHISKKDLSSSDCSNTTRKFQHQPVPLDEKRPIYVNSDITKGAENVKISLVDEFGNEELPKFTYMRDNVAYQDAYVHVSLARIADEHCCSDCSGDCLSLPIPCACARETGGEFAYTSEGLLKEEFLRDCMSMKGDPQERHFVYCQDCPLERSKNEFMPEKCKGHLVRRFIKECWRKCGCSMHCRNRIVQQGITCKLQVFLTPEGKGWGLKTLQDLPKGTFVCEYVGEILTNMELYNRNMQRSGCERHTYPVTLDADWGTEKILRDEEALCLDATLCGNVARFINHRCCDANLIDIPVEVETPDHHYYHLALFTTRDVNAFEELTWDYQIDFHDHNHPIKAFQCLCGSAFCRGVKQNGKRAKSRKRA